MPLLTEEQARRRFCPKMVVVSGDGLSHSNRWGNDIFDQAAAKRGDHATPLNCCIASECMAWRVSLESLWPEDDNEAGKFFPVGFCGLAGRVEG